MAVILPPTPIGVPPGHSFWNDWYEKLRSVINQGAISVLWSNINFTGSNLTDLATRNHSDLTSLQGGVAAERFHLTTVQHTRATSVISKAGAPVAADIAASQWAVYKNTSSGEVRLWANDAGTMKSVLLS